MKEVYCQNCGKELTHEGGDVTSTGRVYCHGYKEDGESRCVDHEMMLMFKRKAPPQPFTANRYSPEKVQKLIEEGELIEYGRLETETK